jgi:hypothetical protein
MCKSVPGLHPKHCKKKRERAFWGKGNWTDPERWKGSRQINTGWKNILDLWYKLWAQLQNPYSRAISIFFQAWPKSNGAESPMELVIKGKWWDLKKGPDSKPFWNCMWAHSMKKPLRSQLGGDIICFSFYKDHCEKEWIRGEGKIWKAENS